MKRLTLFLAWTITISSITLSQGPNRTFGNFKKEKGNSEIICVDNCATIVLIYEKGTFINSVKAAIGIDDEYSLAVDKSYYAELKIAPGVHKIILPQGVNQGGTIHTVKECDAGEPGFTGLCSMYSNAENYTLKIGTDVTDLKYNLTDDPYTTRLFAGQINYLTYNRDFKAGETCYFKSLKLPGGLSLSCGPIVTETTQKDFEEIIKGKKIKGKGEAIIYKEK
jgi:hypothetical protein